MASCGGTSGGGVASASNPTGPQDFSFSVSPTSLSTAEGAVSGSIQLNVTPLNGFAKSISVSVQGLPNGITSSNSSPFAISTIGGSTAFRVLSSVPTGSYGITFQASSGGLSHSASFTLVVTAASFVISTRTNFIRVDAIPGIDGCIAQPPHKVIAYDPAHNDIFVANGLLNRVQVFSSLDGRLLANLAAPTPSSVSLSPDGSLVWVGTATGPILAINTSTLEIVKNVPFTGVANPSYTNYDIPDEVLMTSSGKALVNACFSQTDASRLAEWNPNTGTAADIMPSNIPVSIGLMARSADGSKVLIASADSDGDLALYDAATDSITAQTALGSHDAIIGAAASRPDGSQFAVWVPDEFTLNFDVIFLDSSLNVLASLPWHQSYYFGMVYSRDGRYLYLPSDSTTGTPAITVIDTQTFQPVGQVADFASSSGWANPEDIDPTGLLFENSNRGIAMVDAANPMPLPSIVPQILSLTVTSGSSTGATATWIVGSNFDPGASVFFGTRPADGTVFLGSNTIAAMADSGGKEGVANVTVLNPDGWFSLDLQAFNFGPTVLDLLEQAGQPGGGDTLQIIGFGFGTDSGQVSVTIGGNPAKTLDVLSTTQTLNSVRNPFDYPFPIQEVDVQTPAGTPGLEDVMVSTPDGSTISPRAFDYLKEDNVYPLSGNPTFLTYDQARQRIYISNVDHVDVFDLASRQFLSPLVPPGGPPPNSSLSGLALTPDGSELAVADAGAQEIYIFDLNSGTARNVSTSGLSNAGYYPARLAATSTGQVFVGFTSSGSGCGPRCLQVLDLTTLTFSQVNDPNNLLFTLSNWPLIASADGGREIAIANGGTSAGQFDVWYASTNSVQQSQFGSGAWFFYDVAAAAEGSFFAAGGGGEGGGGLPLLFDTNINPVMRFLYQEFYTGSNLNNGAPLLTLEPGEKLHPSGSLLYQPFRLGTQGGVDIFDTHEGTLRRRVYFTERPREAGNAMQADLLAIDENGKRLFALTASGLSVVDLAAVPLSIGSLGPNSGPTAGGTAVTVRGSGFVQGTVASIDQANLATTVADPNTLQIVMPASSAGVKRITVTNPDGSKYSLDGAFTYN